MDSNLKRQQIAKAILKMPDSDNSLSLNEKLVPYAEPREESATTARGYSVSVTRARQYMEFRKLKVPPHLSVTEAKTLLNTRKVSLMAIEDPFDGNKTSDYLPEYIFPGNVLSKAQSIVSALKFTPSGKTHADVLQAKVNSLKQSTTLPIDVRLYRLECILAILLNGDLQDLVAIVDPVYSDVLKMWMTDRAQHLKGKGIEPDHMPDALPDQHKVIMQTGGTQSKVGFHRMPGIYKEWCKENPNLRRHLFPKPIPPSEIEDDVDKPAPATTPSLNNKKPPGKPGGQSRETTV